MSVPRLDLEPREELRDDDGFVDVRIAEPRPGSAALEEERPTFVVSRQETYCSGAVPPRERIGLAVGFGVGRRVQFQHRGARRHDERVRRLDRVLELQIPELDALLDERGQPVEPLSFVRPLGGEECWDAHGGSLRGLSP